MPPVTCYICGRDFGTRSIGIHIPSCTKKWDNEQEKLPKSQRRPVPTAPENFEKVISGEIKGKELVKMNQKAFDDYNETALESCPWCGRTFLPTALAHHRKACTEERPMIKSKGGYQSKMKDRVQYPTEKKKKQQQTLEDKKKDKDVNVEHDDSIINGARINGGLEDVQNLSNGSQNKKGEESTAKQIGAALAMSNGSKGDLSEESLKHTLRDEASQQIKSKMGSPDKETGNPGPVSSANINGYGTFKKKRSMNGNATVVKTTDQIIDFIEHEPLFDHQEHRLEVMNIIKNYVKEARRKEILAVLDSSVFDEEDNVEEVARMINNFVAVKSNNNNKM